MSTLHSIANIGMRRASFRRLVWRLDTPAALAGMFALAFAIRLLIAPHAGYYADLKIFQGWSLRLDDFGLRHFYAQNWADYPPGYLYVLWLLGKVSAPPGYVLLKLPAILGDLALAWIAGTFATRIAPPSVKEQWPVRPLVAAAVLFNPAMIMVSAVWGQVDVVPAVFVLWSLFLLFTGRQALRRELAASLSLAIAVAMKPQACFVVPVMVYALYRRHLHRRPRSEWANGVLKIAANGAVLVGFLFLSALPFDLGPDKAAALLRRLGLELPVHERERLQPLGCRRILAARFARRRRLCRGCRRAGRLPGNVGARGRSRGRRVACPPRGRKRRQRDARAHDRCRRFELAGICAADANARALHVLRARLPRPGRLPAAGAPGIRHVVRSLRPEPVVGLCVQQLAR